MVKKNYFNGGSYFCKECNTSHHMLSGVGKKHINNAKQEIKQFAYINYGVY